MPSIEELKQQFEQLELEFTMLREWMHQMNAKLRDDFWETVTPVAIDLKDFQRTSAHFAETLEAIDRRTERLETQAAEDKEERPIRQEALDTELKEIKSSQQARAAVQDRRWRVQQWVFLGVLLLLLLLASIAIGAWFF